MDYKQLENIITRNGWNLVRIIGSSRQYRKPEYKNTVIISNHGNGKVSIDILKALENTTGLSLMR